MATEERDWKWMKELDYDVAVEVMGWKYKGGGHYFTDENDNPRVALMVGLDGKMATGAVLFTTAYWEPTRNGHQAIMVMEECPGMNVLYVGSEHKCRFYVQYADQEVWDDDVKVGICLAARDAREKAKKLREDEDAK